MFLHFHLPLRASPTLSVRVRTTQLLQARTTRARNTRVRTTRARTTQARTTQVHTTQARTTQARITQMLRARTLIQPLLPLLPLLRRRHTSMRTMASPDRQEEIGRAHV